MNQPESSAVEPGHMGGKRREPLRPVARAESCAEPPPQASAAPARTLGTGLHADAGVRPPEIDWLASFRDGDRSAFGALVDAFQHRLVAFFFRMCWDRDRAEDLTQDLFLKLLRGATRYQPEGKLSTFVFRVATNLWIDHYRQVRPQPRFASLEQVLITEEPPLAAPGRTEATGPLQSAIAGEERETLRCAVEKLTTPHRLVFELAVFQQLPYGDVAGILDIPVGTVKSRMHNAMHALKGLIAGPEATENRGDSSFRKAPGIAREASARKAREACG